MKKLKRLVELLGIILSTCVLFSNTAYAIIPVGGGRSPVASSPTDIVDYSFDKCSGSGVVSWVGHHQYGFIGVNGGGDWEKNPCLRAELRTVSGYALYVNTNYPSSGCSSSISRENAYNCGFNLGKWDANYAKDNGANINTSWWIDTEIGAGIPWSEDSTDSSFLFGLKKALQASGASAVGYYSTASMWSQITGGWKSGTFSWYATGVDNKPSSSTINSDCNNRFTGGSVEFYQYVRVISTNETIDMDSLCPGASI